MKSASSRFIFKFVSLISLLLQLSYCKYNRPNVIFILADDLGWNDVSFHGSHQIPTLNIDKLANEGIILNNYYVSPICTPSRAALMTGKYPIHTGMQHDVIYGPQPYGLPLQHKLLPEYLRELGYVTRIVGKWHLGFFHANYTPTARGFDSHFGYFCGHQDYYEHTAQETTYDWGLDMRNGSVIMKSLFGQYSTELFNQEAVRLINSHDSSKPLFLYLAHLAVHAGNPYAPLQAPRKYVSRFPHIRDHDRRIFAGMTAALDDSVGDVLKALEGKGMLNNSIIIFSTDNGGPAHGYDGNAANNWPLKGTKNTLWEGGVRASGFIWSPMLKKRKRVSTQLMHISDWLPTLYHAVGGNMSEMPTDLDGMDMWPALSYNLISPRKEVLHNIDDLLHIAALRHGDYKVVIGRTFDGKFDNWFPLPTERKLEFKLSVHLTDFKIYCGPIPKNASIDCQPQINPCLFNIRKDPCEFYNLATEQPDIVQMLMERLHYYNTTAIPPVNKPDDPKANPRLHGYVWRSWVLDNTIQFFKNFKANHHRSICWQNLTVMLRANDYNLYLLI